MNNILNENDNKKRMVNSVKTRDFGRYHDMLNKSFEVLDSISNQCKDPKGKLKEELIIIMIEIRNIIWLLIPKKNSLIVCLKI